MDTLPMWRSMLLAFPVAGLAVGVDEAEVLEAVLGTVGEAADTGDWELGTVWMGVPAPWPESEETGADVGVAGRAAWGTQEAARGCVFLNRGFIVCVGPSPAASGVSDTSSCEIWMRHISTDNRLL